MSEGTNIEWVKNTGGPWLVCTEVSPGCAECYARDLIESRLGWIVRAAYRKAGLADWETRPIWGKTAPRVKTKGFWRDSFRLNARAEKDGERTTIFPSLIDWLDDMPAGVMDQDGKWLDRDTLFREFLFVVFSCQWVNWLLLTKRPEMWLPRMIAACDKMPDDADRAFAQWVVDWRDGARAPSNVAIGFSAENQEQFEKRVAHAVKIPAGVRFISAEPLLGPVDVSAWLVPDECGCGGPDPAFRNCIHFVIPGGESGSGARVCRLAWLRSLVAQCKAAGVRVLVKQLGGNLTDEDLDECARLSGRSMKHPKGGDMAEWPPDLRVRDPWPAFPPMEGKDPRINVYVCRMKHLTVTVDVDDGVTPFMIGCKAEGCDFDAHSSFYPRGPKPADIPDPEWEWFKPSPAELAEMDPGMRQHCEMGGLDMRKRTNREPRYHEEAK